MKISELFKGGKIQKGLKLKVRVPSRLQEKLGPMKTGELVGLASQVPGTKCQLVTVKIDSKKYTLRPQDLSV